MNIELLKESMLSGSIEWRKHALQKMFEREISRKVVKEVVLEGEIIKSYDDDKPFPSALFFKKINNRPIHVIVSVDESNKITYIISAYEPSLSNFESDYKTRKKK